MARFFSYRGDQHYSRVLHFDKDPVIPTPIARSLEGLGVLSLNETYDFLVANSQHRATLQKISRLSEDAYEVLEEKISQKLEQYSMIDTRCGKDADPCLTLPRNLIKPER